MEKQPWSSFREAVPQLRKAPSLNCPAGQGAEIEEGIFSVVAHTKSGTFLLLRDARN